MNPLTAALAQIRVVPNRRWHTLAFLSGTENRPMVHLGIEVDATALVARRQSEERSSVVAQVVAAVGAVWHRHPDANSSYASFGLPFVAAHRDVDVKLSFDITAGGTRTVQSAVLPAAQARTAAEITRWISDTRSALDAGHTGPARVLDLLPGVLGRVAFDLGTLLPWGHRALGTVAVTSLGHRRIRHFYSDGGTTMTVGIGQLTDTVVLVDGVATAKPILPLSLSFDHRVIDGALAAEVAADLASTLETADHSSAPAPVPEAIG